MGVEMSPRWVNISLLWALVGDQERRFMTEQERLGQMTALHDQYSRGLALVGSRASARYSLTIISVKILHICMPDIPAAVDLPVHH